VTPADAALASFWQGGALDVSAAQSGGTLLSVQVGSGGATPAGGQFRLPGEAGTVAPSASLIAPKMEDDAWLSQLRNESLATPDAAASPFDAGAWAGGAAGFVMLAGSGGWSSPSGSTGTWNSIWSMTNADGTTTVSSSSGSSSYVSSWDPSGSSDVVAASNSNSASVTSDASGVVLASHSVDTTSSYHFHSVAALGSPGQGSSSTSYTLSASGSNHTIDFQKQTLHRNSASVSDQAEVTHTDDISSSYSLTETGAVLAA